MWFECEQPFLSGERCVTSRKTAAKETTIVMGLKTPISHCFSCQVVIAQFVIGQFHKPITFKVVV